MISQDFSVYREILENLLDGVIVIDFSGSIVIANHASCQIFEFDRSDVVGKPFAEVFIQIDGFDEFTQIILDVIVQGSPMDRRVTNVQVGDRLHTLALTTSFLYGEGDESTKPVAVIAVFTDITEIRELRETELRQAKEIESQHHDLQKAYRDIESRNAALSQMSKKVRGTRVISMIVFAGLFVGVSGYYLQTLDPFTSRPYDALVSRVAAVFSSNKQDSQPLAELEAAPATNYLTMVVTPQPFRSTISLRGNLAPGNFAGVISPFAGHISELFVKNGQSVGAGDLLMTLDTEQIQVQHRNAEVDYIKKLESVEKLNNWDESSEMADARRRYRRVRLSLDDARKQLNRTKFLYDQGIIPESEYESAERNYITQTLDHDAAEQELQSVANKAGPDERRVAELEAENSRTQMEKLKKKLEQNRLVAPISGIIQLPSRSGAGAKDLNVGMALEQGQAVVNIANFDLIAVSSSVDEVEVGNIETSQQAWITGPGFPDLRLEGTVASVANRARNRGRGSPQFDISVELDDIEAEDREKLRVGMSAHATIVTYDKPEALLVPITAVSQFNNEATVQIVNAETRAIEDRTVELGLTTLDSVEVLAGLEPGEEIVLRE